MQVMPVDLTALIASVMGISIVLIPVIGLTARFALKPTVEALGRFFESKGAEDSLRLVERRLDLMEQHMELLQNSMDRIADAAEFDAKLQRGGADTPRLTNPHNGDPS